MEGGSQWYWSVKVINLNRWPHTRSCRVVGNLHHVVMVECRESMATQCGVRVDCYWRRVEVRGLDRVGDKWLLERECGRLAMCAGCTCTCLPAIEVIFLVHGCTYVTIRSERVCMCYQAYKSGQTMPARPDKHQCGRVRSHGGRCRALTIICGEGGVLAQTLVHTQLDGAHVTPLEHFSWTHHL